MELLRGFKSVLGAQNEDTEQSGSETVCSCVVAHIFVEILHEMSPVLCWESETIKQSCSLKCYIIALLFGYVFVVKRNTLKFEQFIAI